jgi:hypothetical protein
MPELEDKTVVEPPVVDEPKTDEKSEEQQKTDKEWDTATDEVLGAGKKSESEEVKKDEEIIEKTDDEKTTEQAKVADEEDKKAEPTTADIVRDTLREADISRVNLEKTRESYQKEIIDSLYPEGVDRQLVDAEGNPINGVSDLLKLINPETNEYFSHEEAASYLLDAQQKLNKELTDFDKGIEAIADTNITLLDGAKQVASEYGELLKALPDVAKKLKDAYFKTLTTDPKTNIILKATIPIDEFYEASLAPYKKMADQLELKADGEKQAQEKAEADAKAAEETKAKDAKTAQSEREDIMQSGKPVQKSKEDEEWDDAMDEVLGKPRR